MAHDFEGARLALADAATWERVVVMTAATEDGARRGGDDAKATLLAELRARGVTLWPFPAGEDEYETLARVIGPIAGYVAAVSLANAIAVRRIAIGVPAASYARISMLFLSPDRV